MGHVRVGTASWTDRTLIESGWYPPEANTPEKRLRYYARQFGLVEVDATYYALPTGQTAALWATRTPPGFTFNVKAFSLFTQHPTPVGALPKDLRPAGEEPGKDRVYLKDVDGAVADEAWQRFLGALEPLREAGKLGAILLQFPRWFPISRARKDYIVSCAQKVAPDRVCVEFRNRTWMTPDNQHETLEFLAANRLPYVCVDMPQGHPDSIPPVLAATTRIWPWSGCTGTRPNGTAATSMSGSATTIASKNSPNGHPRSPPSPRMPPTPRCCSTTVTATMRRPTPSSSPACWRIDYRGIRSESERIFAGSLP
jgi:uncharacterized protein YecE (DUF72 family)